MNKTIAFLAFAAVAANAALPSQASTFGISSSTSGTTTTFRITRSGEGTESAETVQFRTVGLSAMAGQNYIATNGVINFAAGQTATNIAVSARSPSADVYKYQSGTTRTYRFELRDEGGFDITNATCGVSSGLVQFKSDKVSKSVTNLVTLSGGSFSSGMASSKYLDVSYTPPSGDVQGSGKTLEGYVLIDDSYDYAQKPATVSSATLIDSTGAPASYLNSLGYKIYATVCFTEKEKDDGYQYLQIVAGNSAASYDTGADPNGAVKDPTNSVYKVCFELADGSHAEGKAYFPHRGTTSSEFSNSAGRLWQQKYKNGYDGSGAVVLPANTSYITTRFDAGGDNDDTWGYKDFFVRMALVDSTQPTLLNNSITASPGPHCNGDFFYISVPFSEIVYSSGIKTIYTTWGFADYHSGDGSNVITFRGTVKAGVGTTLAITNCPCNFRDIANNYYQNSASGLNKTFDGTTVAASYAYPISYDLGGGTLPANAPTSYTYDAEATLVQPTRAGYTFDGWTGSNGSTPQKNVHISIWSHGRRSYMANWSIVTYTNTYDLAGGALPEGESNPETYTVTNATFSLVNPIRTGYTFTGWTGTDLDGPTNEVTVATGSTGDRSYVATWTANTYSVRFNDNDGSSEPRYQEFSYDQQQSLDPAIARTGYDFAGWCTNEDVTVIFANCAVVSNLTAEADGVVDLYARWVGHSYIVRFDGNAADAVGNTDEMGMTYDVPDNLTSNGFTRTGYDFAGWSTSANGAVVYADGVSVSNLTAENNGSITFYAQWTAHTYTIRFDANGGEGEMSDQLFTYDVATNLEANAFSRIGYDFAGWSTSANGAVVYADGASVSNLTAENHGSVTLYAQWTAHTYTVRFDPNAANATGSMADMDFTYDQAKSLSPNQFSRPYFDFVGWTTEKNGAGDLYADGATVSNLTAEANGTVMLYAKWYVDYADYWGEGNDGSEEHPYVITTTDGLDLLASAVNGGETFGAKYFGLGADIAYPHSTDWNDATSTENNFTAIGNDSCRFKGDFDGRGHTVSGIRIYKGGSTEADCYQGLFGNAYGIVKNVTISDARMTGYEYVGGVAGFCKENSVENCHATDSVAIHAVVNGAIFHGGIAGLLNGYAVGCTSSAHLTVADDVTQCQAFGGIGGFCFVSNCLAIGVTTSLCVTNAVGALVGMIDGGGTDLADISILNGYYGCTVGGENANVGCGCSSNDFDATDPDIAFGDIKITRPVSTFVAEKPITLAMADAAITNYAYNGVTVYDHCLGYRGKFYVPVGTNAVLSLELQPGYSMSGFTASAGVVDGDTLTISAMPAEDVVVGAADLAVIPWSGSGTAEDPYIILYPSQLDLLATKVNGGTLYDQYFKLGADIAYDPTALDENGENYTAIGDYNHNFCGNFDGAGRVISGIRINKTGRSKADKFQGLFGRVHAGTVRNVTLADCVIVGEDHVGGIVGYQLSGTIVNCRVEESVIIGAGCNDSEYHGGIVGNILGGARVHGCFSAAAVTNSGKNNCWYFGGIVGQDGSSSDDVQDCLALGSAVTASYYQGAITGWHNGGIFTNNYYAACTVNGTTNATNVGCGRNPAGDIDGARLAHEITLRGDVDFVGAVTNYNVSGLTAIGNSVLRYATAATNYYYSGAGQTVVLSYTGPAAREGYRLLVSYNDGTDHVLEPEDGVYSFTMPDGDVTVSAEVSAIPWEGSGTAEDPWQIRYTSQLDLLAENVTRPQGYERYKNKYFLQVADLVYDGSADNYTPVGKNGKEFRGHYDGGGHVISGINLTSNGDDRGVFGYIEDGSVKNLVLANSTICGYESVGGIAGFVRDGTISNCRVESSVTIGTTDDEGVEHGGIVGYIRGSIFGCISAATVVDDDYDECDQYGGIVGCFGPATVMDSLYIGTTVKAYDRFGAIAGAELNTHYTNNYYIADGLSGGVGDVFEDKFGEHAAGDVAGACRGYSITLGPGVRIAGEKRTYGASGLTAIGDSVLRHVAGAVTNYYSGEGQTITLSYDGPLPDGCAVGGYVVNDIYTDGNTFEMPAEDVTVTVRFLDPWQSLQAAINAADGATIVLDRDYVAEEYADRTLTVTNAVTLDLAGHTIDANGRCEVFSINYGGNLTLTNSVEGVGAITGGADYYSGVYVSWGGAFTMTGGTITGNSADYGGGVCVYFGGTFTMTGGTITGNSANNGGGVYVSGGAFTMSGGVISGNSANNGGGVYAYSVDEFTISGSPVVAGNTNSIGAANNAYLLYSVITVSNLTAGASIGVTTDTPPIPGVPVVITSGAADGDDRYFFGDIELVSVGMAGGEVCLERTSYTPWDILQNRLDAGGVVALTNDVVATAVDKTLTITSDVTLDLAGHTIDAAGRFGVIEILDGGNLTLTNSVEGVGAIAGGHAYYGGGVCVDNGGVFAMTGGAISGNTADWYGGGVYVNWDGAFLMTGGTISGNFSDIGGGVYVAEYVSFTVSGSPVVSGNTNLDGAASNVYLPFGCTIAVSNLTDGASIGVTTYSHPVDDPVTFAIGAAEGDAKYFFSDNPAYFVGEQDGELYLDAILSPWGALQRQLNKGGTVTLTNDVTAADGDARLTVTSAVALDLNGHTITGNGDRSTRNGGVIYVGSGGNLTLTNSVEGVGAITGGYATHGGGVYVTSGGAFTMTGGEISGNTAYSGGGVYVDWTGTFTMTGGEISGNTAYSGGGVYVDWTGTFTMTGGEISGNAASNIGGGVYVDDSSTFMVSGSPAVSGNTNSVGAANNVYLSLRVIEVGNLTEGASIGVTTSEGPTDGPHTFAAGAEAGDGQYFFSDNPAYYVGEQNDELYLDVILTPWGALQRQLNKGGTVTLTNDVTAADGDAHLVVRSAVTLDLNGHTITGNVKQEEDCGGVIYVGGSGNLTLTNSVPETGAITGGYADYGGGVYVNYGGAFTMAGGAISGNSAEYNGGGVYVDWTGTFTMTGGAISGNEADYGGGVEVSGTFTMTGGAISGNEADYGGGGVFVREDGRFIVSDSPVVFGNTNDDGAASNVYLSDVVMVVSNLHEGAFFGVTTYPKPTPSRPVAITSGAAEGDIQYFTSDIPERFVEADANGELCVKVPMTPWAELQALLAQGGVVTLTNSVVATPNDTPLVVTNTVILDLAGHTIDAARRFDVLEIADGGNLTLTNSVESVGAITGGNTGVNIDDGGVFTMTGGAISGNHNGGESVSGGVEVSGTFTMTGGTISGNYAAEGAGGVKVSSGGVFTMTGGTITGNYTDRTGCGVRVSSSSSMAVSGRPVISGNTNFFGVADDVFLGDGATFAVIGDLEDGAFIGVRTDAKPMPGSPVAITSGAAAGDDRYFHSDLDMVSVRMTNGEVCLERSSYTSWEMLQSKLDEGGVVSLTNDVVATACDESLVITNTVTLDLAGHTIDAAGQLSVIEILDGGNLTLTNSVEGSGAITGVFFFENNAVRVGYGGTFTMAGGEISGNSSDNGGGVYVKGGTFTMAGGTISGNTASDSGGGVYVGWDGVFTMTGGTISGNAAPYGGVCVEGDFTVSGSPVVAGNTNFVGAANDVWLCEDTTIAVGNLAEGASIGVVTEEQPTLERSITITSGATAGDVQYFFSDDSVNCAVVMADGELHLVKTHSTQWEALQARLDEGGAVTLTDDVAATLVDMYLIVTNSVLLDLNGHSLVGNGVYLVLVVGDGGDLTLTNSVEGVGAITGGYYSDACGGVGVIEGGTFTMTGGTISGNRGDCGGVFVNDGGVFLMTGGAITGNTAKLAGGGVYVDDDGTFTMTGGEISGNSADDGYGGGVFVNDGGTFAVSGSPVVSGNATYSGAANNVWLCDGQTIAVSNLADGASIGVTTEFAPTAFRSITITSGAAAGDAKYFFSDSSAYSVGAAANGELYLVFGMAYPAYLDGANNLVKANYDAWAAKYGPDTDGTHEAAFLLNIAPSTAIPDGASLLKVVDFSFKNKVFHLELASDVCDLFQPAEWSGKPILCNGFMTLEFAFDLDAFAATQTLKHSNTQTLSLPVSVNDSGHAVIDLDFGSEELPAAMFVKPTITVESFIPES